jgi:hypothetical protein
MFRKLFSSDVVSMESPLRIPPPPIQSRFEEAWKEFDRLDAAVHGRGRLRWVRAIFEGVLFGGAGLALKYLHHNRLLLVFLFASYVGLLLVYTQIAKSRFGHWQCPRCHAEWPGTKKEKDPRCLICGLRLHELA